MIRYTTGLGSLGMLVFVLLSGEWQGPLPYFWNDLGFWFQMVSEFIKRDAGICMSAQPRLMDCRNRCSRVCSALESIYWASCWSGKHHHWRTSWLSEPNLAYKRSWQLHYSAIHYPIWWVERLGGGCKSGHVYCACVGVCGWMRGKVCVGNRKRTCVIWPLWGYDGVTLAF